ncbi:NAD(P)H-dependent oxidoreductase [Nocardia sp. NPDC023852]|uniref:NADPH-dependent FMN reductase n=1 Tax=unclassified Nocardia TaxID=2637762 RepID=UPI0033EEC104|nr:NAD(P)H-dependent oxidoreductase [Nocardia sp. NBC_00881]
MPATLQVVIASTRPGRAGKPIGDWFAQQCRLDGRFTIEVTDLAELALPMMDEPHNPRARNYVHEHTRSWSSTVDACDAVVFVMPEYNHGFPAPLKNALDYLHDEWAFKPAGFVSYGGLSGGMRAVQLLKPVLTALRMLPLTDQVALSNFAQYLVDGVFDPGKPAAAACTALLDELSRTTVALARLRPPVA